MSWILAHGFSIGRRGLFFCRSGVIVFRPLRLRFLFETASNALLLSSLSEWLLLLVVVPSFKAMEVLLKMGDRSGARQQITKAIFTGSPDYHWSEDIRPIAYSFYSQHRQREEQCVAFDVERVLGAESVCDTPWTQEEALSLVPFERQRRGASSLTDRRTTLILKDNSTRYFFFYQFSLDAVVPTN